MNSRHIGGIDVKWEVDPPLLVHVTITDEQGRKSLTTVGKLEEVPDAAKNMRRAALHTREGEEEFGDELYHYIKATTSGKLHKEKVTKPNSESTDDNASA